MEMSKMEKVSAFVKNINKVKKVFKLFICTLKNMKQCLNCSIVTVFVLDSKVTDIKYKDYVYMQNINLDGKWIDRIGIDEKTVSEPSFKKMEEI